MNFEIDISGEDLLQKDYAVCIANKDGIIKGFKFSEHMVNILCSRYGQGKYKYKKSRKGKATFKVKLYCIVAYYLVKSLNINTEISLTLCRYFEGKEKEIRETLTSLFKRGVEHSFVKEIYFDRLAPGSNAHKYAYLMRKDARNKMGTYIEIEAEDIERWLRK